MTTLVNAQTGSRSCPLRSDEQDFTLYTSTAKTTSKVIDGRQ
jgi:hypothetical protein